MARYFKYKSPADLTADAAELGYEMPLARDLSALFTPVQIGDLTAANRLAVHPMEGCDGMPEGLPDELTYRRYRRFGAGGAKIIWGEATAIAEEGRMNPRQLLINDRTVSALDDMLEGCRAAHREAFGNDDGLIVGLQLTHSGRYSYRKPLIATHDPILDPLTLDKSTGKKLDATYPLLTDDELKRIEDQFVAAAKLAYRLGVDFIDVKQCHRYLLSELLASKNRLGPYGGALENRLRLVLNVIGRVRDELPDLVIASRMNAYDAIPYRGEGIGEGFIGKPCPHELPLVTAFGTDPWNHLEEDLDEPIAAAQRLSNAGLAMLSISMGNPYANPHVVRPAEFPPVDGYHCPEHPLHGVARHFRIARQIQAAIPQTPVLGSGYSWLQEYALRAGAANVERGDVAIVGLGRATLSHPDFARTAQETGRMDRKRICRTFSYCTGLMRAKDHPLGQYPTGCPPFDKEVYGPIWKEVEEKRGSK